MKSLHKFDIEPDTWRGPHGAYLDIIMSSYPDAMNEDNHCDICQNYSDYFVNLHVWGIYSNQYNSGMTRLCNGCIIKIWFDMLFKMRVPKLSK